MSTKLILFTLLSMAIVAPSQVKPPANPIRQATKPIPPFALWQLRPGASSETQVTNTTLNPQGHWLLLYLDLKSPATTPLLTQIATLATPTQPDRPPALDPAKLVLVAATATGSELSQFALKYPALASAAWTHDLKSQAATALAIQGTPHLFGMIENHQVWQFSGALPPATLQPMTQTWLAANRLPPNKLTLAKQTRHQSSTPPTDPPPQ